MATATKNPATTRTVTKTIEVQEEVPATFTLTLSEKEMHLLYALVNTNDGVTSFDALKRTLGNSNKVESTDEANKIGWHLYNVLEKLAR